jgi:organic hydroperoxide reductase OsmC/OhrA
MISIIGIYCNEHGHNYENGSATVTKIMASSPRRIGKIVIEMDLRNNGWDETTIEKVKRAALACPVAKSVSEDIELEITFNV